MDARREVLLRGSVVSLRKMWKSTKISWRVGRRAAIKIAPDDGWEMVFIAVIILLFHSLKAFLG